MITTEAQYQRLLHEQLKAVAPTLWSILMCPWEAVTPPKVLTMKRQRKALRELAEIAKMPIPRHLFLDDEDS